MAALMPLLLKSRRVGRTKTLDNDAREMRKQFKRIEMHPKCVLLPCQTLWVVSMREASKKSGGSSRNQGGKSPGRRYGFKRMDGGFVHAGNILATQGNMRWYPGAHVGIGSNKTLYALEDGIVRFTKEVYIPLPYSQDAASVVKLPKGAVLYKTFINVVPTKQEGAFKLVDMV